MKNNNDNGVYGSNTNDNDDHNECFFSPNIQPPFEQKKIYFKFTHEAESPGTLQRRIKLHENFYSCLVPPDTNAVQLRSSTQNNT